MKLTNAEKNSLIPILLLTQRIHHKIHIFSCMKHVVINVLPEEVERQMGKQARQF